MAGGASREKTDKTRGNEILDIINIYIPTEMAYIANVFDVFWGDGVMLEVGILRDLKPSVSACADQAVFL